MISTIALPIASTSYFVVATVSSRGPAPSAPVERGLEVVPAVLGGRDVGLAQDSDGAAGASRLLRAGGLLRRCRLGRGQPARLGRCGPAQRRRRCLAYLELADEARQPLRLLR